MKKLSFALTAVFLFGPIEPVFADSDISGQFTDMVTAPARQNHVWAGSTAAQGSSPWVVESWSGGRRRVKRIRNSDNDNYQNGNQYASAPYYNPSANGLAALSSSGASGSGNGFGEGSRFANGNRFGNGNNSNLLDNSMDMQQRKPDKFADNPQIDQSGVRHFANGRHYDLKAMPIEQAVSMSAASDEQIMEDRKMQQRLRQQQRNLRNNNFF